LKKRGSLSFLRVLVHLTLSFVCCFVESQFSVPSARNFNENQSCNVPLQRDFLKQVEYVVLSGIRGRSVVFWNLSRSAYDYLLPVLEFGIKAALTAGFDPPFLFSGDIMVGDLQPLPKLLLSSRFLEFQTSANFHTSFRSKTVLAVSFVNPGVASGRWSVVHDFLSFSCPLSLAATFDRSMPVRG